MNRRQVFIDTETTGISARSGHRIIELAAVEAIDGRLSGKTLHTYLDPQRSIDPAAQRVHGIASAALVGKPKFQDIATDFMKFVEGAECLMHNAAFDRGFIDAELSRAGIERRLDDITTVTCTLKLARQCFPGASASLDALIVRAGIPVTRQKHSALEDAMLLADIYFSILAGLSNQQPSTAIQPLTAAAIVRQAVAEMVTPEALAMEKTIEMVMAKNETFYYRNQHKRIIEHHVINERRWRNVKGPLVYAVTDQQGLINSPYS